MSVAYIGLTGLTSAADSLQGSCSILERFSRFRGISHVTYMDFDIYCRFVLQDRDGDRGPGMRTRIQSSLAFIKAQSPDKTWVIKR